MCATAAQEAIWGRCAAGDRFAQAVGVKASAPDVCKVWCLFHRPVDRTLDMSQVVWAAGGGVEYEAGFNDLGALTTTEDLDRELGPGDV